jgi:hypothetical protein
MNMKEFKAKREKDRNNGKNSLDWILPIARNVIRHMHSEELYEFVLETLEKKQNNLIDGLLSIKGEEE